MKAACGRSEPFGVGFLQSFELLLLTIAAVQILVPKYSCRASGWPAGAADQVIRWRDAADDPKAAVTQFAWQVFITPVDTFDPHDRGAVHAFDSQLLERASLKKIPRKSLGNAISCATLRLKRLRRSIALLPAFQRRAE